MRFDCTLPCQDLSQAALFIFSCHRVIYIPCLIKRRNTKHHYTNNLIVVLGGGYAEYVAVEEVLVMPVPYSCKLSDAAAIPENWLTSYQLLHPLGKVKSGEVALIHAGGSGVGTTLVQLSRLAGARPYVTAGSEEKIKMAVSLGVEAGFNYKTGKFDSWIESVSDGNLLFLYSIVFCQNFHGASRLKLRGG